MIEYSSGLKKSTPSLGGLFWLFLAVLLLLRLLFILGDNQIDTTLHISMFVISVCLIILERGRLNEFLIDDWAIWLIIIFKPLETIIRAFFETKHNIEFSLSFPKPLSFLFWILPLLLLILTIKHKFQLPKCSINGLKWIGVGMGMGVITAIVTGFILSFGIPKDRIIYPPTLKSTLYSICVIFPYQIGYAAITEEPLFRGFLWGALRKQNWKEGWINIFQTILFTISHLYYFNTNRLALFITVPFGQVLLRRKIIICKNYSSSESP